MILGLLVFLGIRLRLHPKSLDSLSLRLRYPAKNAYLNIREFN